VIFNVTETQMAIPCASTPRTLRCTACHGIYRSELASRLKQLGYEIERAGTVSSNPGYSKEYLEASILVQAIRNTYEGHKVLVPRLRK